MIAPDTHKPSINSPARHLWKPVAVFLVSLSLTVGIAFFLKSDYDKEAKEGFNAVCNHFRIKISDRIHAHAQILRSGAAFFAGSDTITRFEWKSFNSLARINQTLPGQAGLGYVAIIPGKHLHKHILQIRREWNPDYDIYPPGEREMYTSILYFEPFTDGETGNFGYDLYTDSLHRNAMVNACDSNIVKLTGKVNLSFDTHHEPTFGTMMYVPVYRQGLPVGSVAERREAIIGWVFSPYKLKNLIYSILGDFERTRSSKIRLQIYDQKVDNATLLFDNRMDIHLSPGDVPSRSEVLPVESETSHWVLCMSQYDDLNSFFSAKVLMSLISGFIISCLLFFIANILFQKWHITKEKTRQLTTDLKASETLFSMFMEYIPAMVFLKDAAGKTVYVNKYIEEAIGSDGLTGMNFNAKESSTVLPAAGSDGPPPELYTKSEATIIHRDNTPHDYEVQQFSIQHPGHEPLTGGICVDITERKHVEELLLQIQCNYETFFNTLDVFLFVIDSHGYIIHMNATVIYRLGYSKEDLAGHSILMVHPPDKRDEATVIIQEMVEKKVEHCSIPLRTKQGVLIPVETRVKSGKWNGEPVLFGFSKDISQIKLSEEKFSKVFHLNPSACGLSDPVSGVFTEVNAKFNELFGYTNEEVIGKNAVELGILSVETAAALDEKLGKAERISDVFIDLKTKSGETKHVVISGETIRIQESTYRFTVVFDVTELLNAEEALKESETKYRELVENSPDAITIYTDGKVAFANRECLQLMGATSVDQLLGKPVIEFVHPDFRDFVAGRMKQAMSDGTVLPGAEETFLRLDGTPVDVEVKAMAVRLGNKPSVQLIIRDITERKRSMEALMESEQRMRTLFATSPSGIIVLDERGVILDANDTISSMTDYTIDELIGRNITMLVRSDQRMAVADSIKQILDGATLEHEVVNVRKDGTLFNVMLRETAINLPNGKRGILSVSNDITERKQTEVALRELNKTLERRVNDRTNELETINKELNFHLHEIEQLTYIASHDLQEPLRTVSTFAKLLKDEYSETLDEVGKKYIDFMYDSAGRMSELVKGVLVYALLGKDSIMKPVNCNMMVTAVIADLDDTIKRHKAVVHVGELPEITCFETDFRTLLLNLINNGIKFHQESKQPEITISCKSNHKEWVFSIQDNGIGIEAKHLEKVFILFKRLHKQHEYGGTGIGLAHCRKIVELHGGKIWVESEPGVGSTFLFTIPKR